MTQFDFYLNNLSFRKPDGLTLEILQEKIEQFAQDCEFIREQDNENIMRHSSVYDEIIYEDFTVSDICNLPDEGSDAIGRDYQVYLQTIVHYAEDTTVSNEEIIELLGEHDEELVNGLLCLHEINEVNRIYCVYDKNDWFAFHRHFLCVYPPERTEFCQKVKPYFPNLYFNENSVVSGLNGLHTRHPEIMQTIVHHLSALNDVFYDIFNQEGMSGDRACEELENHYRGHEVRIGASRDSNNLRELNFEFLDENNNRTLYCDLHTKFYQYYEYSTPSYPARGNRIYFHQPISDFKEGKVLIARIGRHASN